MDWFRLAQDRSEWKKLVHKAFPVETVLRERERELDQWRLGDPIPAWARQREDDPVDQEFSNSEDELGERRRGGYEEPEARVVWSSSTSATSGQAGSQGCRSTHLPSM